MKKKVISLLLSAVLMLSVIPPIAAETVPQENETAAATEPVQPTEAATEIPTEPETQLPTDPAAEAPTDVVRAQNTPSVTGADEGEKPSPLVSTPKLTAIANIAAGQKIDWSAVKGAPVYRVYIKSGSKWNKLADTTENTFTNTEVKNLKCYTYTVRCLDEARKNPLSDRDENGITATFFAAPTIKSVTSKSGAIAINWNAVKGAARYGVFVKQSGKWVRLAVTDKTSWLHKNPTDDTLYAYTVRCINKKGNYCSGFYPDAGSIRYYAPVMIAKVTRGAKNKPVLSWNKTSLHAYIIERKAFRNGGWTVVGTTTNNSFKDNSAAANTLYTYRITGQNACGDVVTEPVASMIFYRNGMTAHGKFTTGGGNFIFNKGKLTPGYYTVNKRQYYFNADTSFAKNGIVGSKKDSYTYADKYGVCCTSKEIRLAADYLMRYCTGKTMTEKMKSGFAYMAKNYTYQRIYFDSPKSHNVGSYAVELFTTKRGTCYRYAAGFACLARLCGYRVRFVNGIVAEYAPHGWTEVYYNGKWRICDPDYQLPSYHKPAYHAYMMNEHDWDIRTYWKSELVIKNGKAVWQ